MAWARHRPMEPIIQWLEFRQYGEVFGRAGINRALLPDLTEADLEKPGVVLGHRKKLLQAIAALSPPSNSPRPAIPVPALAAPIVPDADLRRSIGLGATMHRKLRHAPNRRGAAKSSCAQE